MFERRCAAAKNYGRPVWKPVELYRHRNKVASEKYKIKVQNKLCKVKEKVTI